MNLSPLRHTFGSMLETNGCNLKTIMKITGHRAAGEEREGEE
jgi:integrase